MNEFDLTGSRIHTVQFQACDEFRGRHDDVVCPCGWLEDDHLAETAGAPMLAVVTPVRARRPRISVPERRAS